MYSWKCKILALPQWVKYFWSVRSYFILQSTTTMFLPIKQDNFPQKQSTSGKRKKIPNIIWGQNKKKWVAMKFFKKNVNEWLLPYSTFLKTKIA